MRYMAAPPHPGRRLAAISWSLAVGGSPSVHMYLRPGSEVTSTASTQICARLAGEHGKGAQSVIKRGKARRSAQGVAVEPALARRPLCRHEQLHACLRFAG